MHGVNAVILDRMQSKVGLIPELAGHLIAGGGKRMRPMLTLGCAALLGYSGTRHQKLAAAVEFIHTATLLHDDVVDGSGLRRGKRTANLIWGNPATVLVGDFLFSRAFELMVEDGSPARAQDPQPRLGGDRRRRGRAAHDAAPDRDRRGAVSHDHLRQDRRPVRGRLPHRPGRRRGQRRGRAGAREVRQISWDRLPADRRRARLRVASRTSWARASATISATARSPCP